MAPGTLSCLHRLRGRGRKTLLWGQLGGRGRAGVEPWGSCCRVGGAECCSEPSKPGWGPW